MNEAHILPCSPIAKALAVVGDRWSALVMREMFLGTTRFGELAAATGASRATLSKRLRALVANGLLYRNPYQARPPRVEYRLTEKGFGLYDFALAIWAWEARWSRGTDRRLPPSCCTEAAGTRRRPGLLRPLRPVLSTSCAMRDGAQRRDATNDGALRRSPGSCATARARTAAAAIDLIADHWTPLVLAAVAGSAASTTSAASSASPPTSSRTASLLVGPGCAAGAWHGGQAPGVLTEKGRGLLPALGAAPVSPQAAGRQGPSMQLFHDCSPELLALRMDPAVPPAPAGATSGSGRRGHARPAGTQFWSRACPLHNNPWRRQRGPARAGPDGSRFACIRKLTDKSPRPTGSEANPEPALNDPDSLRRIHGPLLTGAFAPVFEAGVDAGGGL
jgi:DNA-binding HxlR family transcriptional regulator